MAAPDMENSANPTMAPSVNRDLGTALCIITGASKGFGRSLATEIAGLLMADSVLILVARSGNNLRELQVDIASEVGNSRLNISCVVADLGTKDGVDSVVQEARKRFTSDIDHLLLFNNAASLGDVSRFAQSFTNMEEVDSYLSLNVSSALCLTAGILSELPHRTGFRRCVVNISSLCAIEPFPSWVLYCAGKAAREMMFRVLAQEDPQLRVLNYAPGPLDTDMQVQARTSSADTALRTSFSTMHSKGQLLTCEESISKLLNVLLDDNYASGAHVDYYDI